MGKRSIIKIEWGCGDLGCNPGSAVTGGVRLDTSPEPTEPMWAEGLRTSGSQLGGGGAVRILCGSFTTHTRAKIRDKGEMCTLKKVLQVRAIRLQIGVQRAGQMGPTEVLCLARGVLKVFEFEQLQGTRAALYRPHQALSPTCVTCLAPGSCNPYTRRSLRSSPDSLIHR